MTYDEFKNELYQIRDNQKEVIKILTALEELEQGKFDKLVKVSDPTRDRTSRRSVADDPIFEAIESYNEKRQRLANKLLTLREERKDIQEKIWNLEGTKGAILISFFVFGNQVKKIAEDSNYSEAHVFRLIRTGIEELYQYYVDVS